MTKRPIVKWIIIISAILLLTLLLFLPIYSVLGKDLFGGTAEILSRIADTQIHWWVLGITACFVAIALLTLFVLPFIFYFLSKLYTYFSIASVCIKEKYSCKLTRIPLASISGTTQTADIEIKMTDKKIFVHFIDIPFGFRKTLTIIDQNNYLISTSTPGKVNRIGGGPPGGKFSGGQTTAFFGGEREASDGKQTLRTIPDYTPNDNEFHYLIIMPQYIDAKVIEGNGAKEVSAETAIGKITVCKYKTFKKRLKNQLYTPMNGCRS